MTSARINTQGTVRVTDAQIHHEAPGGGPSVLPTGGAAGDAGSSHQREREMAATKAAAGRHVQAFNNKNLEELAGNESPDIEFVIPGGITLRGRDQVQDYMKMLWSAFPDMKVSEDYQVIAGDTAVTESAYSGTHTGTLRTPNGDIPATGKRVQGRRVAVQRIKEGKIWSEHLYFDQMEFLGALGLIPSPSHI